MNFDKLKGLVKASNIGITPHPTIEANRGGSSVLPKDIKPTQMQVNNYERPVPTNHVPQKPMVTRPVPTNYVPQKPVITKPVPTSHVPQNIVITKPVPTSHVPQNIVPTNHVPQNIVPTNHVPQNHVPTNHVPTNSYVPVNQAPILNVGTSNVGTRNVGTNNVGTKNAGTISIVPSYTNNDNVGTKYVDASHLSTKKLLITKVEIDQSLDENLLNSLGKADKINYLAQKGWRLNAEIRGTQVYDYAIKYINREKKRIYLGKTETQNI